MTIGLKIISARPSVSPQIAPSDVAELKARHIFIEGGKVSDDKAASFSNAVNELPRPTPAYCRTGTLSATLRSLSKTGRLPIAQILAATQGASYDMNGVDRRVANGAKQ